MKIAALSAPLALLFLLVACRTLAPYPDLLVGNRPVGTTAGVTITYLGCNGFLVRSGDEALLIDPCFTRPSALDYVLNRPIPTRPDRLDAALGRVDFPDRIDAILVTHAHYDHLLDVPAVQRRFGGRLLASPSGCFLARASGIGASEVDPVLPGARRRVGSATVHVLDATHDRIFGFVPNDKRLTRVPNSAPSRPSDYVCGKPLAFLIEIGGKTLYFDSGGRPEVLPPRIEKGIDLAVIGAALPDSRRRFLAAVERLRPGLVYPSHQDNFFRPLDKPYRFNLGTNFPSLKKDFEAADTGAELILFDFFQTLYL